MISDLREIPCQQCGKKGLRGREKITNELILDENNQVKEMVYWHVFCDNCSTMNKILWNKKGY